MLGNRALDVTGEQRDLATFGDDPAYLLEAVDGSVELRSDLLWAAHAVGAGVSDSRG